jgi:hypothetical protein
MKTETECEQKFHSLFVFSGNPFPPGAHVLPEGDAGRFVRFFAKAYQDPGAAGLYPTSTAPNNYFVDVIYFVQ